MLNLIKSATITTVVIFHEKCSRLVGDDNRANTAPEPDRIVSLVAGVRKMMDRATRIAINKRSWILSDHDRQ